jgi:hypothetical protein
LSGVSRFAGLLDRHERAIPRAHCRGGRRPTYRDVIGAPQLSTKWLRRRLDRALLTHRYGDTEIILTEKLDTDVILASPVVAAWLLSISVAEMDRLHRNGELVAWHKGRRVPCVVSSCSNTPTPCRPTNKCSKNVGGAL